MCLSNCRRAVRIATFLMMGIASITGAQADVLITGARIAKVLNVRSAGDASFVVLTEGGTGSCVGQWIFFYPSGASSPEVQKRAFAQVLMAQATGMRVDIESSDATCANAYAIFTYP
jgi:hypothetical protein